MSFSAIASRLSPRLRRFGLWLAVAAGIGVAVSTLGWGLYGAFHQQFDAASEAESDEIAFLDWDNVHHPSDRPATAAITDVVSAVNQQPAGRAASYIRPASGEGAGWMPSAWLSGTIEAADDGIEPQPKVTDRPRLDPPDLR